MLCCHLLLSFNNVSWTRSNSVRQEGNELVLCMGPQENGWHHGAVHLGIKVEVGVRAEVAR